MKIKQNILLLAAIFVFLSSSCKKEFLEVENNTALFRQSYVKDLGSMKDFLNGVYLTNALNIEFCFGSVYPDLVADNLKPISASDGFMMPHYSWTQQADKNDNQEFLGSGPTMNAIWLVGYRLIRSCSFVIEETGKYRNENPALADDLKGQAYAMRAMLHFKIVNLFAQHYSYSSGAGHSGVPYVTESDITRPFVRNSVKQVYDGIISDYQEAIKLLPAQVTDVRNMNVLAVKALLAQVYLFKEDFINAKTQAAEVLNQKPLMTIAAGYPTNMFKLNSPAQTEVLFQITPGNEQATTTFLGALFNGDYKSYYATNDLGEVIKDNPNDIRSNWLTGAPGSWVVAKFPKSFAPEVPGINPFEASYYQPVIRSSEACLILAEANAMLGDDAGARVYLNQLRKRADASATEVSVAGAELIGFIRSERRKELCFEGTRLYDLQRWKLGVHRSDFVFDYAKDLPYPSSKAISPIPPQDVNLSGISQNPDY